LAEQTAQLLHQASAHGILTENDAGNGDDDEQDGRKRSHDIERDCSAATKSAMSDVTLHGAFQDAPHRMRPFGNLRARGLEFSDFT
jgi:hypothetical protein